MQARNQAEFVKNNLPHTPKEVTEKISLPGIETLHTKSFDEISAVLANVLKSRPDVVEISFRIGESIKLTYKTDRLNW